MDLQDLQYLITIADAGSLVRAAERLGITQPTLSKSVARLERMFRVKLIERLACGVRLTPYGQAVVTRMGGIDVGIRDMFAELRDLRQGKTGSVTFGVGTGIPPGLVAAAIKPLSNTEISFTIVGGQADMLLRSLRAGDIEFAVTIAPPTKNQLVWQKLFDDPMMPIAHKNHPLVQGSRASWADLAAARWIVPVEGTSTREWFEDQFRHRDLQPPVPAVALDSVAGWAGLGATLDLLALLPASSLNYLPVAALGAIVGVPDDWYSKREVGVVHRSSGYLSAAAKRLINSLATVAAREQAVTVLNHEQN